MFSLAEKCLQKNPDIRKVVIFEHPPRFDLSAVDPISLKSKLARLANSTLSQLWLNSPLKDNIFIGQHSLESSGAGAVHLSKYKNQKTGRYDGVHFYGPSGCRDYTDSVKTILMLALPEKNSKCGPAQPSNQENCPQSMFQNGPAYHPSVHPKNRFGVFNSNSKN